MTDYKLDEINKLRAEAELLRMQLAACGVVALANTTESADKARAMHPKYMNYSCQCVMGAVDREMALRDQVCRLVEALTMARGTIASALRANAPDYFTTDADIARHVVIQRIDTTLAAYRKQCEQN